MATTDKERAVLVAIRDSEYRTTADLTEPVWSFGLEAEGVTPAGMGGVFASLAKKGMVLLSGSGDEATVSLTERGIAELPAG